MNAINGCNREIKHQGYLDKKLKPTFCNWWKTYWCVLDSKTLFYFKTKEEYESGKKHKGQIDMQHVQAVRSIPGDDQRNNVIQIITWRSKIYLCSTDEDSRSKWVELLQDALCLPQISDPITNPNELPSGNLYCLNRKYSNSFNNQAARKSSNSFKNQTASLEDHDGIKHEDNNNTGNTEWEMNSESLFDSSDNLADYLEDWQSEFMPRALQSSTKRNTLNCTDVENFDIQCTEEINNSVRLENEKSVKYVSCVKSLCDEIMESIVQRNPDYTCPYVKKGKMKMAQSYSDLFNINSKMPVNKTNEYLSTPNLMSKDLYDDHEEEEEKTIEAESKSDSIYLTAELGIIEDNL